MKKLNITNYKTNEIVTNKYEHLHDVSLPKLNQSDVAVLNIRPPRITPSSRI